jgi:isoleucyl-tRNA synthetase
MKTNLKVRQPLADLIVVLPKGVSREAVAAVAEEIKRELNVKRVDLRDSGDGFLTVRAKANFAKLGQRLGSKMKPLVAALAQLDPPQAAQYRETGELWVFIGDERVFLSGNDLIITVSGPEGYHVEWDGRYAVGLNTGLDDELITEGYYRELINKIQNLRKTSGLAVTDRIRLGIRTTEPVRRAVEKYKGQIAVETLADEISENGELKFRVELKLNGQPTVLSLDVSHGPGR